MSVSSRIDAMILQNRLSLIVAFDGEQVRAHYVASTPALVDDFNGPIRQYDASVGSDLCAVISSLQRSNVELFDETNKTLTAFLRAGYIFSLERQTFKNEPSNGVTTQAPLEDVPRIYIWGVAPRRARKNQTFTLGADTVANSLQMIAGCLKNTPEDR